MLLRKGKNTTTRECPEKFRRINLSEAKLTSDTRETAKSPASHQDGPRDKRNSNDKINGVCKLALSYE